MIENDDAKRFDCETLSPNGGRRVLLSSEASKAFWKLDRRDQARLVNNMDLWAAGKPLTDKQFNGNEGRVKGINRMLMAFKVHAVRCYGFECPLEGSRTFIIVDVDPAKKDTKAKPRILARARERVARFEEKYGERYG